MLRNVFSAALVFLALPFAVGCAGAADERDDEVESTAQALTGSTTMPKWQDIKDGVDVNGTKSFVLDRGSKFPIIFQMTGGAMTNLANNGGFELKGDLQLITPVGSLDLLNADITLTQTQTGRLDTISGTVSLAAPNLGYLQSLTMNAPLSATIAYELGKDLKASGVSAPILDGRKYLGFTFSAGLSAQMGPVNFNLGEGKGGTLVLDPSDPSFFTTGNLVGLDGVGPLSGVAFGMSAEGLLQFTPGTTWGINDANANGFTGHLYSTGTVKLSRIPISITGEAVFNLDPTHSGQVIGRSLPAGFEVGVNGSLNFDMDVKALNFSFPLATATTIAKVTREEQEAWISANIGPDTTWMPNVLPLIPSANTKFAALVSSAKDASYVKAETDLSLDTNKFYSLVPQLKGITLPSMTIAQSSFLANSDGVTASGSFTTPGQGFIQAGANATVLATFPAADRSQSVIHMDGDIVIGGVTIASAAAQIDKSGFSVNGQLSTLKVSGSVTHTGAMFDGFITLPLKGTSLVMEETADAVYCGYTYADDVSSCAAKDLVSISETVACDFQQVTDGAKCGFEDAGDDIVCGLTLGQDCKKPKTCTVSMGTCNQPVQKCKLPATCPHLTADTDFDFGTLTGDVHVAIIEGTVSASVSGNICPPDHIPGWGSCPSIGTAKVTLGAKPQVCVSGLDHSLGDVCVNF